MRNDYSKSTYKMEITTRERHIQENTMLLTAQQKRLYQRYEGKKYTIERHYKRAMLRISEEFKHNMSNPILTRKDCQNMYNEQKSPIEDKYDRQMSQLEDWYYKEKERLK